MSQSLEQNKPLNPLMAEDDRTLLPVRDRQLRMVFETVLDAIAIVDDEGRYLDVNPAACELFGLERDELLRRCISDFTEPGADFNQLWQEFQKPEKARGEFPIVRADGDIRVVEYAATGNFMPHGHLLVMREITEHRRAEAQVRELTQHLEQEVLKNTCESLPRSDHIESINKATTEDYHHLEQISRHIPGVIYQFRLRPDGTSYFPYASEGLREVHGVSPEEVREDGSKIFSVVHPNDLDRVNQSILDSAEHLTSWYCEYQVCLPDGRMLWLVGNSTPQREPDGSTLWHGYIRDISDRKQAELENWQIQKFLSSIIENIPNMVFVKDAHNLQFLRFNKAGEELLGYHREALLGKSDYDFFPPEEANFFIAKDREVLANGKVLDIPEEQIQTSHQGTRILHTRKIPILDEFGNPKYLLGISEDITDRKRREQALRLIVEGTAAKIGQEFFKSCVQYLAQVLEVRYALIAEFVNSEKSIAKTIAFWAGDDFGENFTYSLIGAPCQNSQTEFCLYPNSVQSLFPEDRDLVTLQVESYAGLPIVDASGNCLGLLVVMDTKPMEPNIEMPSAILRIFATRAGAEIERLQAEAAVRQSEIQLRQQTEKLEATLKKLQNTQTQLIQAEKMSSLGQLVAGIAHEINNPVSFIYGNLQPATDYASYLIELIHLYQEHYPSPPEAISNFTQHIDFDYLVSDFSNLLKSMKTGATRISDIVKSLRTFSRLDQADLKAIDIHENIESSLVILQNRLNGQAGKPEINLIKHYGDLAMVECYGGLLNQVFMNLLLNAIDAIEQQRKILGTRYWRVPTEELNYMGEITITTSITSENQVLISIQDNGCGMNFEVQQQIFNPFFTTKPVGKGTGMGLATSYQIVKENHRGNLRCFSTPGQGAEFAIELPIVGDLGSNYL